jgi:hypothetical protein
MNTLTKVSAPASTSPVYAPVLAPASFGELVQFAQMAAKSQLVPKEYRNQPEDIMLAVQLGSEVGLRPMQALQNIAVINGRPAVWGDALPGLCKASPVYDDIVETWEHEHDPDLLTAVCVAKRHGSTPVTARFSVMDAKRAGLWTKSGPWQTYPRRMLQMRARSFALRDAFPDVLKGLMSVEEALDNHTGAAQLAPPTIEATAEPTTLEMPPKPAGVYQLTTKQGTTTFRTGKEWLAAWAKIVRGCKVAKALDKLQTAREANQAHIGAIAAFDPEAAATLTTELDRALGPLSTPS